MRILLFICVLIVLCASTKAHFDWNKMKTMFNKAKTMIKYTLGGRKENIDGKPWFCHDLDCPEYQKVGDWTEEENGFEKRCYPASTWVATMTQGPHGGEETKFKPMFWKLFEYIEGDNEKKEKIKMTAPVVVATKLHPGNSSILDIRMHFYVPPSQAKTLPKPNNPDVFIVNYGPLCAYVHSFGGWVWSVGEKLRTKQNELVASLKKENVEDYDDSMLYYAGYDSPMRLIGRHNEVWLGTKEQ